jgi:hypothetical protein
VKRQARPGEHRCTASHLVLLFVAVASQLTCLVPAGACLASNVTRLGGEQRH